MKVVAIVLRACGLLVIPFLLCFTLPPLQALAQDDVNQKSSQYYSRGELAQMVSPIALYPDALLSQILMASTYPIELVEADRWVRSNPKLKGDTLDAALLDKDWDPSVKAICHFPSVLALMSERITETTNLGNAFLAQEADVMDMVQELRAKAYAEGNLSTSSKQKVIVERETIIIQPADPRVIYLPYYKPYYAYGLWGYPAYPPYYWAPTGVSIRIGISYWPGIYFGFAVGTWSYFDWHRHYIHVDVHRRPRFVRHDRWITRPGRWHHAPRHRRGVAYHDKFTAQKYGQSPKRSRVFRRDIRGFPEHRGGDPRSDGRPRAERDRPRIDRGRTAPNRQQHERGERTKRAQEQASGDIQRRQRIAREKQKRKRVERKKAPTQAFGDTREHQRIDRAKRERERAARGRRVERAPQIRQRPSRERGLGKSAGSNNVAKRRRSADRRRDNVFNQVENAKGERRSSNRGRSSRKGQGGKSRRKNRSDEAGRQGRDQKRR